MACAGPARSPDNSGMPKRAPRILSTPEAGHALRTRASRQHGVVTRQELLADGVSERQIERFLRISVLGVAYRGVYVVGHDALSRTGRRGVELAVCGPTSFLSHWTAFDAHGVRCHHDGDIHVTTRNDIRLRQGATCHRSGTAVYEDVVVIDGQRVSTIPRGLVDLAAIGVDRFVLANLLHEAAFYHALDPTLLIRTLARGARRAGCVEVRRAAEMHASGSVGTRSELEHRLLLQLLADGAPEPVVNGLVRLRPGGFTLVQRRRRTRRLAVDEIEPDLFWPRLRFVVETDGSGHGRERTKTEDSERDNAFRRAGIAVLRVPGRRVHRDVGGVSRQVRRALDRRCGVTW